MMTSFFFARSSRDKPSKSYGIQVARLAGLPKNILDRAKEILSHLEMSSAKPTEEKQNAPKAKKALPEANSPQMNLFD